MRAACWKSELTAGEVNEMQVAVQAACDYPSSHSVSLPVLTCL